MSTYFFVNKEGSIIVNKEKALIKELENFYYDNQYLKEMKEIIEQEDFGLAKIYSSLQDMKFLQVEIGDLDIKLKKFLEKLIAEEEMLLKALEQKQKIHNQINGLEPPFKNVLYYRYICDKTFCEIADKMNYSTKRIYQLHKEAIDIYCKKYN